MPTLPFSLPGFAIQHIPLGHIGQECFLYICYGVVERQTPGGIFHDLPLSCDPKARAFLRRVCQETKEVDHISSLTSTFPQFRAEGEETVVTMSKGELFS